MVGRCRALSRAQRMHAKPGRRQRSGEQQGGNPRERSRDLCRPAFPPQAARQLPVYVAQPLCRRRVVVGAAGQAGDRLERLLVQRAADCPGVVGRHALAHRRGRDRDAATASSSRALR